MEPETAADNRGEGDPGSRRLLSLELPPSALVVLVGPAGSGKTTFANRHFAPHEVLSTDWFRKVVADDETDQSASPQAFAIVRFVAARRLRRGGLTVIDSTSLSPRSRSPLLYLAQRYGRAAAAVVFDIPLEVCLMQNRSRPDRTVADEVVRWQWEEMHREAADLRAEGFASALVVTSPGEALSVLVSRG